MVEVPASFAAQPRWWQGGQDWLASLPLRVDDQCRRWGLSVDGEPLHGSNALVVPVTRAGELLALRLCPPTDDVAAEIAALAFWDGCGTVRLLDGDPQQGVMLLERLDSSRSLQHLPVLEAAPILGRMMTRLAVETSDWVRSTAETASQRRATFTADWRRLGRPFEQPLLEVALDCARVLSTTVSTTAVNGDLHFEQVLAGQREEWLCVDPVLLRGDREYDLARILWHRLDELSDVEIEVCFDLVVQAAELDVERARRWMVFRSIDYWLWGLDHGLTEDPLRCARLVNHFR